MVIGISGKAGQGKDTLAKMINYWYANTNWGPLEISLEEFIQDPHYDFIEIWEIKKFAGALKKICAILLGVEESQFEDQEFKKSKLGPEWGMTVREFLQKVGTEAMRDSVHPDIWVNALFAYYTEYFSKWIITDVRFPNEVQAIKKRGGIIIRIEGLPTNKTTEHISETLLDNYQEFDYHINNPGTYTGLYKAVCTLCEQLF